MFVLSCVFTSHLLCFFLFGFTIEYIVCLMFYLSLKMKRCRFLLGFGSETGQSRSVAQGMVDVAREQHQITADIYELDDVDTQVIVGNFH